MRKKMLIRVITGLLFLVPLAAICQQRPASRFVDSAITSPDALKVNCGVDILLKELRKNADFVERERKMNDAIQKHVNGGPTDPILTLPVVVHIINTTPNSITDADVANGIKDLNDAFSKSGNYAASTGADTRIQFVLAKKDSLGGLTTGIDRVTSYFGTDLNMNIEDYRMKSLIQWDPKRYINIWLVKNIQGEINANFSCGIWTRSRVGGYATMPNGTPVSASSTDGIVVPGFGVVLAHEMGHYLGLYHTFEGGCTNNNCATDGDHVCDTPPDGTTISSPSCDKPSNTCNTDTLSNHSNGYFTTDVPDPISNFMDYGNTACSNQFTQGQADRMRAAIQTQRPGLLSDVITAPCSETISVAFTPDKPYPKTGENVIFTQTNTGLTGGATYQWFIGATQLATGASFSHTFATAGKYKVTLKAYNNAGCFTTYTYYMNVTCGVMARFYDNKRTIASKAGPFMIVDTILLKNISEGATSYQWTSTFTPLNSSTSTTQTITSNAGGNPNDLNYAFASPGNYSIKLKATNGSCSDEIQDFFFVQDPTPDAYISITNVNCYQNTKVQVGFYVCNFGYAPVPINTPVTFYDADPTKAGANQIDKVFSLPDSILGYCCGKVYTQILDVGYRNLNQLYAVVGDKGGVATPVSLPNTALPEKNYTNNIASYKDFRFKVTPNITSATLEPGDTLQLIATTSPDFNSTYIWSSATNLSCPKCNTTFLYADTNTTKQVIATSQYQCFDTAYVDIKVPPPNNYAVAINSIVCAGSDSLQVGFTVSNSFKRGILPKKLQVAFYNSDPAQGSAVLLPPVFILPDSVLARQKSYFTKIKKLPPGLLYAVVNDTANQVPVQLPNTSFIEKDYTNNTGSLVYKPVTKIIDTAICNGDTLLGHATAGSYSDLFSTTGGCDSVRVLNLTIKSVAVTRIVTNVTICQGETYAGYSSSGTYTNVFKGTNSCDSIRTLNLTVNPVKRTSISAQICKGFSYLAGGQQQTKSGTYIDSLKTYLGCDSIVTTELQVNPLPAFFLPVDSVVCIGKTLTVNLSGYSSVLWNTGVTDKVFEISSAGIYGATVTDSKGCVGTDSIQVSFHRCIPIQVPDAFTPNGDGKNDYFHPLIGASISNYHMQVWNRWGQVVFDTKDKAKGWDGKYNGEVQPNGAYIYLFSFLDPDGVSVIKQGTFVLIR